MTQHSPQLPHNNKTSPTLCKVVNALLFQACWFSAILVGWEFALFPLSLLILFAFFVERGQHAWARVLMLVSIGIALDSAFIATGLYTLPEPIPANIAGFPLWLVCMWSAFALTLGSSLSWWQSYPKVFILACAIAGPCSYFAGTRFEVLDIPLGTYPLHALAWAGLAAVVCWTFPNPAKRPSGSKGGFVSSSERRRQQICGLE